jgi:CHAD domain-containing protein
MSRLSKDKPAGKSIHRYLRKRVDAAREVIQHARLSDRHVHGARKELKKARAALRLLRPALKNTEYRLENAALRDAAKPLSAVRDAKVLQDTLRLLAKVFREPMRALQLRGFEEVLRRHRAHARRAVLGAKSAAMVHSRRLLQQSRRRIGELSLRKDGEWTAVGAGLQRTYAQGRRALEVARQRQSSDDFHEWRKQTKHLRYALEIIKPLWPGLIGELADEMHELADYLGDEHDLTVLRQSALVERDAFASERTLAALLALIDQRQAELREKALVLGSRLYQEKPKAFAGRFATYWEEWRRGPGAVRCGPQAARFARTACQDSTGFAR